eukprot:7573360-Heterocapsa_arctica.AAC.1
MVAVPQMGNVQEPYYGGDLIRARRSQAQLPAQMSLGMRTATAPGMQRPAPGDRAHRSRARGRPHAPVRWENRVHG